MRNTIKISSISYLSLLSVLTIVPSWSFGQQNSIVELKSMEPVILLDLDEKFASWENEMGSAIPLETREAVLSKVALDVSIQFGESGLNINSEELETSLLSGQDLGVYRDSNIFALRAGETVFPLADMGTVAAISQSVSKVAIFAYLEDMPTIRLVVDPVPPHDYSVFINSYPVGMSDNGRYKVRPGRVTLRVSRAGRDDCFWNGSLLGATEQEVLCDL